MPFDYAPHPHKGLREENRDIAEQFYQFTDTFRKETVAEADAKIADWWLAKVEEAREEGRNQVGIYTIPVDEHRLVKLAHHQWIERVREKAKAFCEKKNKESNGWLDGLSLDDLNTLLTEMEKEV